MYTYVYWVEHPWQQATIRTKFDTGKPFILGYESYAILILDDPINPNT